MSQRTFEEISEDIERARTTRDGDAILRGSAMLDELDTPVAHALAERMRGIVSFYRDHHVAKALGHYRAALGRYEELQDRIGTARVLYNIADVCEYEGQYGDALMHYDRAMVLLLEAGDRRGVGKLRRRIGIVLMRSGRMSEAFTSFQQALDVFQELNERDVVALICNNLGNLDKSCGRYPEALEWYHRAMGIFRDLGDDRGIALVTDNIGSVYYHTNDYDRALSYRERALQFYEALDDKEGIAGTLSNMGNVFLMKGDDDKALSYYHQALAITEASGSQRDIIHQKGLILGVLVRRGRIEEAKRLLALMDTGTIQDIGNTLYLMSCRAMIQEHHGAYDDAKATLLEGLRITQERQLPYDACGFHEQLRDLALKQNDLAGYVEHNTAYVRINDEINGKETTTRLAVQEAERRIEIVRQEHEKHLTVLHSTLPKHIADRVARGEVVNDHYDNAAVLFLDIVGFTRLSAQMDASAVVNFLDGVFTTCDTVMNTYGLMKIKTIGDSYMAVAFAEDGGAVVTGVTGVTGVTERAARAALAIMDAFGREASHESLRSAQGRSHEVQLRIGLHCGPVVAGVLGKERLQYDVWGDTVNVASRMESTGEPGRIHVSEAFARAVKGEMGKGRKGEKAKGRKGETAKGRKGETAKGRKGEKGFEVIERGQIEVKGKGAMTTYWLE